MPNLNWSRLDHLQLGRYAEYYAKMEFTSYGYEVYTSEVDDHGVDFVAKAPDGVFLEVQVKAVRNRNYTCIKKDKIILDDKHIVCYLRFVDGAMPEFFVFPATVWQAPNAVFADYDFIKTGGKSKPEWGIKYSARNAVLLENYRADVFFQKTE